MIFSLDIVENILSVLLVIVFSIMANEAFSWILFFISNLGLFDEKKNNLLKKYIMNTIMKYMTKIYQLDIYKNKVIYKIEIRYLKTRKIAYCTK